MKSILFELSDVYSMLENIDFKEESHNVLLGDVILNRVVGIAYENILKQKSSNLPSEFCQALKGIYNVNIERTKQFKNNIYYLSNLLKNANFKYALLKGAYLTTKIYSEGFRTSNDIDILINSSDISKLQNLLTENGFVQGYYNKVTNSINAATRKEIIMSRMNYGETIPFIKMINEQPLEIDINFSLDFKPSKNNTVETFLNNTINVNYKDAYFKTLNMVDFLIHLCCHLFKEATTYDWVITNRDLSLYKFSDINMFIHKFNSEEYTNKLKDKIFEYDVVKECYYTFYNTSLIYPSLNKFNNFNKLIEDIKPKDLSFMKQIVYPIKGKTFEYNIDFVDWFFCKNRKSKLKEIIKI